MKRGGRDGSQPLENIRKERSGLKMGEKETPERDEFPFAAKSHMSATSLRF